jgi:hypothetical protein
MIVHLRLSASFICGLHQLVWLAKFLGCGGCGTGTCAGGLYLEMYIADYVKCGEGALTGQWAVDQDCFI